MSRPSSISRIHLVDQALKGLTGSVEYSVTAEVASFLAEAAADLSILTSPLPEDYDCEPLLTVIENSGVVFEDLSVISESLRKHVVILWAYTLTRENLQLARSAGDRISLNAIRESEKDVYDYVLARSTEYLSVLAEDDVTIENEASEEESVAILNDIARKGAMQIGAILDRAGPGWTVAELAGIDVKVWGELAKRSLFPATFENVRLYMDQAGFDDPLAKLLVSAGRFDARAPTEDEELESSIASLAQEVILAKNWIADPATRVGLAASLNIDSWLELPSPPEPGALVGLMIESELIEDVPETFQSLIEATVDWETMELAIDRSKKYSEFVSSAILPPKMASQTLESTRVSDNVKREIISRSGEFFDGEGYKSQSLIAREASRLEMSLSMEQIQALAAAKVSADLVLPFLTPHLSSIDLPTLRQVLTSIGGDYGRLAARSYFRPKFRKSRHIEALTNRLQELDIVSSIEYAGEHIKVHMKRP